MINYHTPAFPALAHWDRHGQKSAALQFPGMTLLDHFAGLALQKILAGSNTKATYEWIAQESYEMANVMLKERAKWIK